MTIRINGVDADITPEDERTVGEVLLALEPWLEGSGHRLAVIGIDGVDVPADSFGDAIAREIDGVGVLDIGTIPIIDLIGESLGLVLEAADAFEAADFADRGAVGEAWAKSASAGLLAGRDPGLFALAGKALSGEGAGMRELRAVVAERLAEIGDPAGELDGLAPAIAEVCDRLEQLPLDFQTGKDARAAETIALFSGVAEKVFRILGILAGAGFRFEDVPAGGSTAAECASGFHGTLGEFLGAYGRQDTVIAGDIAEYEMAPRFRELTAAVLGAAKGVRQ